MDLVIPLDNTILNGTAGNDLISVIPLVIDLVIPLVIQRNLVIHLVIPLVIPASNTSVYL